MKYTAVLALTMATAGTAFGQTPKPATASFQYVNVLPGAPARVIGFEGMVNVSAIPNRPFSATEERHSLQVLGDGTRIENTDTSKIYRDAQGRTRIERPDGNITISDPAEGTTVELNSNDRTVRRMAVRNTFFKTTNGPGDPAANLDKMTAEAAHRAAVKGEAGVTDVFVQGDPVPGLETRAVRKMIINSAGPNISFRTTDDKGPDSAEESLGTQFINGVNAEGHRSTIKIPVGQIGNNRQLEVVSERWFSNDLQMMVKTSNTDPRFGDTTYQMTNIVQGAQDPSLFQVPADYRQQTR